MQDFRMVMRRMAWILIVVGIADIALMIYSVTLQTQQGSGVIRYNSPFFVWTIVVGILLLQNRLTATRIISQMLALSIGTTFVQAILSSFVQPLDSWLVSLRLYPNSILSSVLYTLTSLAFQIWVYSQLTSLPIRNAMDEAHVNYVSFWRKPSHGFWVGACFALVVFLFTFGFLTKHPMALKAKEKAEEKMGRGYKYFVSAMHEATMPDGHAVRAYVVAYNDKEMKAIPLEWKDN